MSAAVIDTTLQTPTPVAIANSAPRATQRVLHIVNGEHYAGAERVQDLLALNLPHCGYNVQLASLLPGKFASCRRSQTTPLAELRMSSRWDLRVVRQLLQLIRTEQIDIVHAHTPRSALVGAIAAQWADVPFLYHLHSPTSRDSTHRLRNWLNEQVEQLSIRNAARLIAVSPTLIDHVAALGVPREKVTCVLNGVPALDGATPRPRPVGPWVIGMVALFRPRKGVEVLLEALAALRAQGADVSLRAIGGFETPEYEADVKSLAAKLGVADAIHWTGFTREVNVELAAIDLLALPSLFGEGLPMVVLEALAAGVPVVASDCEGVAQAVETGVNGVLVPAGDACSLATALHAVIAGEHDYSAFSAAAIARHAEKFSDTAMARQVAMVYAEVIR